MAELSWSGATNHLCILKQSEVYIFPNWKNSSNMGKASWLIYKWTGFYICVEV